MGREKTAAKSTSSTKSKKRSHSPSDGSSSVRKKAPGKFEQITSNLPVCPVCLPPGETHRYLPRFTQFAMGKSGKSAVVTQPGRLHDVTDPVCHFEANLPRGFFLTSDSDSELEREIRIALALEKSRRKKKKKMSVSQAAEVDEAEDPAAAAALKKENEELRAALTQMRSQIAPANAQAASAGTITPADDTRIPLEEKKATTSASKLRILMGLNDAEHRGKWLAARSASRMAISRASLDLKCTFGQQDKSAIAIALGFLRQQVPELDRFEKNWGAEFLLTETFNHLRGHKLHPDRQKESKARNADGRGATKGNSPDKGDGGDKARAEGTEDDEDDEDEAGRGTEEDDEAAAAEAHKTKKKKSKRSEQAEAEDAPPPKKIKPKPRPIRPASDDGNASISLPNSPFKPRSHTEVTNKTPASNSSRVGSAGGGSPERSSRAPTSPPCANSVRPSLSPRQPPSSPRRSSSKSPVHPKNTTVGQETSEGANSTSSPANLNSENDTHAAAAAAASESSLPSKTKTPAKNSHEVLTTGEDGGGDTPSKEKAVAAEENREDEGRKVDDDGKVRDKPKRVRKAPPIGERRASVRISNLSAAAKDNGTAQAQGKQGGGKEKDGAKKAGANGRRNGKSSDGKQPDRHSPRTKNGPSESPRGSKEKRKGKGKEKGKGKGKAAAKGGDDASESGSESESSDSESDSEKPLSTDSSSSDSSTDSSDAD